MSLWKCKTWPRTRSFLGFNPAIPPLLSYGPDLTVLREQFPASGQSRNSDNKLAKWVIMAAVNDLYSFPPRLAGLLGEVISIKSIATPGNGNLKLTGLLDDVRSPFHTISKFPWSKSFADGRLDNHRKCRARAQFGQDARV